MTKRIEITENVKKAIRSVVGDDIDYNSIVVYEACAASTRPIDQSSSVYHKSVMSRSFLVQMAQFLPEGQITLQVMHENGFLPIGKVFSAEVFDVELGHSELNVLFYLDSNSEHVSKIDLAIIDEVSIGALPKHAYCSECNFDFRSSIYAMIYGECENDHQIGVDGCHLRLTDLEKWSELSLVNRGASDKPKILTSAKQRLGKEEVQRLAACGSSAESLYLFASTSKATSINNTPEEQDMDPKMMMTLSSENGKLLAEKESLTAQLELSQSKVTATEAELKNLQTKVTELEASDTTGKVETLTAELSSSKASLDSALATIKPQYKLACTAADIEFNDNATLDEMCSAIEQSGIKLAAIPRSQQTKDDDSNDKIELSQDKTYANHAFITK